MPLGTTVKHQIATLLFRSVSHLVTSVSVSSGRILQETVTKAQECIVCTHNCYNYCYLRATANERLHTATICNPPLLYWILLQLVTTTCIALKSTAAICMETVIQHCNVPCDQMHCGAFLIPTNPVSAKLAPMVETLKRLHRSETLSRERLNPDISTSQCFKHSVGQTCVCKCCLCFVRHLNSLGRFQIFFTPSRTNYTSQHRPKIRLYSPPVQNGSCLITQVFSLLTSSLWRGLRNGHLWTSSQSR